MKPNFLVAVASACAALLIATTGDYGLTVDEPVYIAGADRAATWFSGLFGEPGFGKSLSDEHRQKSWVFARPENYNLPVPVLVSCLGHSLSKSWLGPLISYRVGHCLLLAVTLAILLVNLARSNGWEMATVSAGSLLLMPQVFSHAHLNATDVPAACFWVLSILAWLRSESSWRAGLLAAFVCGLGLATKATFVLLPMLLLVWMILFRRWAWWRAAVIVCAVSPLVMIAFCPMWWSAPLSRSIDYFRSVFGAEQIWKIETYYLGQTYICGVNPIPWHNAIVLPVVTSPPWTLALAMVGVAGWFRTRDAEVGLWLIGAAVLPALRLLPSTPAHDGVRLMMPSLFCFGPLAGFGFVQLAQASRFLSTGGRTVWIRRGLIVLLLCGGAAEIVSMHPYEMLYYTELIGGLAGAESMGFEVSYWFEACTPDALREIQDHLPQGARVWTFPRYEGYPLLREWGLWREDLVDGDIGAADYLVLYSHKSRFYAIDGIERIYARGRPLWSLKCRGVQIVGLYKL